MLPNKDRRLTTANPAYEGTVKVEAGLVGAGAGAMASATPAANTITMAAATRAVLDFNAAILVAGNWSNLKGCLQKVWNVTIQ